MDRPHPLPSAHRTGASQPPIVCADLLSVRMHASDRRKVRFCQQQRSKSRGGMVLPPAGGGGVPPPAPAASAGGRRRRCCPATSSTDCTRRPRRTCADAPCTSKGSTRTPACSVGCSHARPPPWTVPSCAATRWWRRLPLWVEAATGTTGRVVAEIRLGRDCNAIRLCTADDRTRPEYYGCCPRRRWQAQGGPVFFRRPPPRPIFLQHPQSTRRVPIGCGSRRAV